MNAKLYSESNKGIQSDSDGIERGQNEALQKSGNDNSSCCVYTRRHNDHQYSKQKEQALDLLQNLPGENSKHQAYITQANRNN